MKFSKIIAIFSLPFLVLACAPKQDYLNLALDYSKDKGPKLNIDRYLDGQLDGWGVFEDNNGLIKSRFRAEVDASWDDDKGVVKRKFIFSNNNSLGRTWLITLEKDDFSAVGHQIEGTAQGKQYKGLARLVYKSKRSFDGRKRETDVVETIYNVDNNSSISILEFSIAGQKQGRAILSLNRLDNYDEEESYAPSVTKDETINLDADPQDLDSNLVDQE